MWKQLDSEEAVAEAYRRHLHDAFEKPYILGYQRCQYIDRFARHPGVLQQGLLREDGSPYETLVQRVSEANAKAIQDFANIASSPQPRQ